MFIKRSDKIAITADGVIDESAITPAIDVIWIRPKMDFGTRSDFIDAARDKKSGDMSPGMASLKLVELNIISWQGPHFDDVPFTPENVRSLDPYAPLIEKVVEELNTRNTPKADGPNSETSSADG